MPLMDANNGKPKDPSEDDVIWHDQKASHQYDPELERLLEEGVSLSQEPVPSPARSYKRKADDEDTDTPSGSDL